MKTTTLNELCLFLKTVRAKKIYLIHEPFRQGEVRSFAVKLQHEGFVPLVAQDFRVRGENAVTQAIASSDFCLVVAFDDETVRTCVQNGVAVFDMREEKEQT